MLHITARNRLSKVYIRGGRLDIDPKFMSNPLYRFKSYQLRSPCFPQASFTMSTTCVLFVYIELHVTARDFIEGR